MTAPALLHRLHQVALALTVRTPPPAEPGLFPNEPVWRLFQSLHPHDQRHLLAVHARAKEAGLSETICCAALLHDIGKVTLAGTRISIPARVAHVVLRRLSGQGAVALGKLPPFGIGIGLQLAEEHARRGADRLRALGMSPVVWQVVATHDERGQTDPQIRLLQQIDSGTP